METFKVSAFCPCVKCCGKTDRIMESRSPGVFPRNSVAAPSKYPFGTRIFLEGYGTFTVDYRGGSIKNNWIERFFNRHEQAVNWGVKFCKGKVMF